MVSPKLRLIMIAQWRKDHASPATGSITFDPDSIDAVDAGTACSYDFQVSAQDIVVSGVTVVAGTGAPSDFAYTVSEENLVHVSFTANSGFDYVIRVTYVDENDVTQTVENTYHAAPEVDGGGGFTPLAFTNVTPSQGTVNQAYSFDSGVVGADGIDFEVTQPFGGAVSPVTTAGVDLGHGLSVKKTSGNTFKIFGTPISGGFFGGYVIKATDQEHPANNVNATFYLGANGSTTPPPAPEVEVTVSPETTPEMDPQGSPEYATDIAVSAVNGGVTGVEALGLPAGFTGTWNEGVVHLEGTATYTPFTFTLKVSTLNQNMQASFTYKTVNVPAVDEPAPVEPITFTPNPLPTSTYGEPYEQTLQLTPAEGITMDNIDVFLINDLATTYPQDFTSTSDPATGLVSFSGTPGGSFHLGLHVGYTRADGSTGDWLGGGVIGEPGAVYFSSTSFLPGGTIGQLFQTDITADGADDIAFTANGESTPTTTPFNGLIATKTGPKTLHLEGIPQYQPQSFQEAALNLTAASVADPSKSIAGYVIIFASKPVPEIDPYTFQGFPNDQHFTGEINVLSNGLQIGEVTASALQADQPDGYLAPEDFAYSYADNVLTLSFTPTEASFNAMVTVNYTDIDSSENSRQFGVYIRGNI